MPVPFEKVYALALNYVGVRQAKSGIITCFAEAVDVADAILDVPGDEEAEAMDADLAEEGDFDFDDDEIEPPPVRTEEHRRIVDSIYIERIVGEYVPLEKGEELYSGCCPFHDDSDGCLTVYPHVRSWTCSRCEEVGDVVDFVQRYERISYEEAILMLKRLAGLA